MARPGPRSDRCRPRTPCCSPPPRRCGTSPTASTGVLRFVTAPDYENPTDADANIVYVVTVQASDGVGGTATQTLSVSVISVNAPVITTSRGAVAFIEKGSPVPIDTGLTLPDS